MKNKLILIISFYVFFATSAKCEQLANAGLAGLYVNSIEDVLRLSPDEIDMGIATLIVSEAWSDMVAGRRYQEQLDEMAMTIRNRLNTSEPNGLAIPVINKYLFEEMKFKPIDKANDPYDLFLHSVMDRRQGYCLSLSILYLAIGERLGLPLYGVVVPGHFFVRYDDGQQQFNIETTNRGWTATDEQYIKKFNVPKNTNTLYMANLNKRQALGCFFNNLGNVYYSIGNTDQAMASLQWAVYINPSLAESRINLGNTYLKKDRIDDAITEYRAAISLNPDDSKAHNNLGNAYQRRLWFNDAVMEYITSIRLEHSNIDAYRNLSAAYRKLNRFDEAINTLTEATAIAPGDAMLYLDMGDTYAQNDNCTEAVMFYEKSLALKHDIAEAYLGLGSCCEKLGDIDGQISAYKKAIAINPKMPAAFTGLGNAYFAGGKFEAAIEQYKKAVAIEPGNKSLNYNIGSAYSSKGDFEQAIKHYLKVVEVDPQMADAQYRLGFAYYKVKNYDSALKRVKIAEELGMQIDPNLLNAIVHKN